MKKEKLQKREQEKSQLKADHPSGENREVAISVKNVSKTFQVPHEKVDSVRSAFVNALNTRGQTFEEFHALKDVSFEVQKGEFLGIIGSNGAGKSTLLKVLAGVYNADAGSIEVNGLISPFLELGIGFDPELSGRDNVYLNATVLGLTKKEIDEKFDEMIKFAELEEFVDQQLKNYSSGMRARLAFAVSISANRDILLMDEVLAVGDNRFQEKCLDIFKGYRDQGRTVVLVTHNIPTVREHCDRALLLDHGKLLDIGDVDDVADAYILNNMTKDQREELKKKEEAEKKEKARQKKIKHREKGEEGKALQKKAETEKSKKAKITKVDFLNDEGNPQYKFNYNENITVRVDFSINEKITKLNFGVGIYNSQGVYIAGVNTYFDKVNTESFVRDKFFRVKFCSMQLNGDRYYVACSISNKNTSQFYDMFKSIDKKTFMINNNSKCEGALDIEREWMT